ncbi:MAG TPA: hypothetical protein VJM31_06615 [Vicinamibacterales bacterium]|nr:hypothetical protein [Vicinamibacterales bacterium]
MGYRNNTQRAIPYDDVVTAWNRVVSRYSGPSFMTTNKAQVALLEDILKRTVPHLSLLSNDAEGPNTGSVSPVHASFLATFLATQKLLNGSYQRDADVWVKDTRDYMQKAALFPGRTRPTDHPRQWHPPSALGWMMSQTPSDSNLLTRVMHGFLDDLQVGRR